MRRNQIDEKGKFVPSVYLTGKQKKEICEKYVKERLSVRKIAKIFNIPGSLVYSVLKKSKITRRPVGYQKGHKQSNSGKTHFKKGLNPWNNRLTIKDERIRKMSNKSQKTKERLFKEGKIKVWNKGKKGVQKAWSKGLTKKTDKRLAKVSVKFKKLHLEGKIIPPSFKGRRHTLHSRIKSSASHKGISVEEWNGFFNKDYTPEFDDRFKIFIKKRDGCCLICNISLDDLKLLKRQVDVHHINYDKKCSIPQNCISLCVSCHGKVHSNRQHWVKFFQSLLNERYGYKYSENQEIILNPRESIKWFL